MSIWIARFDEVALVIQVNLSRWDGVNDLVLQVPPGWFRDDVLGGS